MMVKDRTLLSGRVLAVWLLLGAAAINGARAEDATPNAAPAALPNGSDPGPADSGVTRASQTAGSNRPLGDKVDAGNEGNGEHHAGSGDGARGGDDGADKGVQHGEDHAGIKHNGFEANPIDTRITVLGKPRSGRVLNWHDRRATKLARPKATFGDHRPKLTRTNSDNVVRNAIGQRLPLAKGAGNNADKKGIETTSQGFPKYPAAGPSGGVNGGVGGTGPNLQHQGFVPAPARDGRLPNLALNAAMNRSIIINGSAIGRPGLRVGAIGGATKNVASGINGTDFRPRHP